MSSIAAMEDMYDERGLPKMIVMRYVRFGRDLPAGSRNGIAFSDAIS